LKRDISKELLEARKPIIEQCKKFEENGPCKKIDGDYCTAYFDPHAKWKNFPCNFATHVERSSERKEKVRLGQQKQKKKG